MSGDGWVRWRLGGFAWEVSEQAPPNSEVLSVTKHDGFVPSLEYFGKQVFSKDTEKYKLVREGQFAYATIHLDEGSIDCLKGRSHGIISPMYTVFDVDDGIVDRQFLIEFLRTPEMRARFSAIGQGSVNRRKSIGFDSLAKEEILLPPLAEQRKIAAILSSVDEAIRATQAVIEQTRRVKEGLLQDLLTRGIGHTRFKKTEIGEIPESWEIRPIEELLDGCTYGVSVSLSSQPVGTPVLRMGNLQDDALDLSELKFADLSHLDDDDILLRPGDLLFNRTNSWDLVGKVALVPEGLGHLSFASYLLRLRVRELVTPEWLWLAMSSPAFQSRVRAIATKGVSQANINPTRMRAMVLAVPPRHEQDELVGAASSLSASSASNLSNLANLRTIKSGLLSDLLTGKTRVAP
jgi:type I restriction enzyme S subunit